MYNVEAANKVFVHKAAYLAKDLNYLRGDPAPTVEQVERWREAVMNLITQHQAAHKEIRKLQAENKMEIISREDLPCNQTCRAVITAEVVESNYAENE